jgi:hypothetical protein
MIAQNKWYTRNQKIRSILQGKFEQQVNQEKFCIPFFGHLAYEKLPRVISSFYSSFYPKFSYYKKFHLLI